MRALRPHQWAKNGLLFLPALAAHLPITPTLLLRLVLGFVAFSALASAVYLLNDLADLPHDREHRTKRNRPIAAGHVSVPGALAMTAVLVAVAMAIAATLPPLFQLVLAGYFAATSAYSLYLKREPLVDVFTLAILYASRLAAGAALVSVPLSGWLIAFSIFFFLSLALAKRVVELRERPMPDASVTASRGYRSTDLPLLSALGVAAAASSSLVFCLYITDPRVVEHYTHSDYLWLGLPALMYWQARVWLWVGRGWMHEDPVVFALRDRKSHLLALCLLLLMVLAR
jgi:4-hydroxybenzoate polyprenyltransferase